MAKQKYWEKIWKEAYRGKVNSLIDGTANKWMDLEQFRALEIVKLTFIH